MALLTAKAAAVANSLMTIFDEALRAQRPVYPTIAMQRRSTGASEPFGFLGGLPQMREWLGDRIFNQLNAATFEVENKEYESSILVDRKDIEDDRFGLYGDVVGGMAEEATNYIDDLVVAELENGGSTPVYDGQYFYDTDHSWGGSGAQSNDITSNVTTPASPTASEFKIAFAAAVDAMLGFTNDQGVKFRRGIVNRVDGLVAAVPLNMRQAAYEAFESVIIANNSNVVVDKPVILTLPGLTSTDKFHVLDVSGRIKPIVVQERRPLKRFVKGLDDREFKELKFMVDWRGRVRAVAWMKAVRVTLN
jgi:phage major head subunit gpT-like protein